MSRNFDNNNPKLNFDSKRICISSSSSTNYIHLGLEGKLSLCDNSGICNFMTFFPIRFCLLNVSKYLFCNWGEYADLSE